MKQVQLISGHTTKIRLEIETDQTGPGVRLPRQICLKSNLSGNPMSSSICALEGKFYRFSRRARDIPAPTAFLAEWDEEPDPQGLVLMGDLTSAGCSFGRIVDPLEVDDVARTLEGLARLHTPYWNDSSLDDYGWVATSMAPNSVDARQYSILADYIGINLRDPTRIAVLPDRLLIDPDRLRRIYERLVRHDQAAGGSYCLIHGDASPSNSYVQPDGERRWLDWQLFRRGRPWRDVTYFIISSLRVEDRRRSERDLLRHYLAELGARAQDPPDAERFWREYRLWPVWGMVSWLSNIDEWGNSVLPGSSASTRPPKISERSA